MVIDSTVFVAVLLGEPGDEAFIEAITADRTRLASSASMLECSMVVLSRKGEPDLAELRAFTSRAGVQIAGFGSEHVDLAMDAFRRFGKGRHAAGLNFGDCSRTRSPKRPGNPCCSKATISPGQISSRPCNRTRAPTAQQTEATRRERIPLPAIA